MKFIITLFILFISLCSSAQDLNVDLDAIDISLDITQLKQNLEGAPLYDTQQNGKSERLITIPTLAGESTEFYVYETISMEEPLYSKFPQVRSYILINKNEPSYRGRLSTGRDAIRIMTKQHHGQQEFIEPNGQNNNYKLYKGTIEKSNMTCGVDGINQQISESQNRSSQTAFVNGDSLRTYSIAIATTNNFYTAFGPTDADVLGKINGYLNLLNDIYEDELAVHFNLIGNNDLILFDDPNTDPINPNNPLTTTHNAINSNIGASNYDIGHGFHTLSGSSQGGSGVASLAILCENSFKGRGWSSAFSATNDNLFMGLFAHEIGHQFGAHHSMYGTESNCSQRSPNHGYEPGGGNSLMAYQTICGSQNITPVVSTFYFHNHSLDEMIFEINTKACHTSTVTANSIPVTTAPINKTIPKGTPFELEGSATDGDGDALFYNWEEYDTDGSSGSAPNAAAFSTTAPLFRSFDPSQDGNLRVFPRISDIVNNIQTQGEILPQVSRNMKFRLTSRDFNTAGGAVSCAEVDITVDATRGPFDVTSQSLATTWVANGSNTATITWDVAGTSSICSNVDIYFSTDRGLTFPFTLASNVTNDGNHVITIPNLVTEIGRIKVKCSDNYFLDINEEDITITSSCEAVATSFSPDTDIMAIEGSSGLNLSLSPNFGASISSFSGSLTTSDPSSTLAIDNNNGGCSNFSNPVRYDTYDFQVSTSGNHTFSRSGPFGIVMGLYEGSYSANSPCANFIASSSSNSITVSLTAGVEYVLLVSSFSATLPSLPASYTITPSPTVFDGTPSPPTGFSYTYLAVNDATDNIAGINASSDFTTLNAGDYTVHGLSYETTNSLSPYVGGSFSTFQTDVFNLVVCGALSTNTIAMSIESISNCPPNYTGANALSGTESGAVDYDTDGAIESTQVISASATVDYDSGTSITLEFPFEVQLGALFEAFIDGCGGALLNENSSGEGK